MALLGAEWLCIVETWRKLSRRNSNAPVEKKNQVQSTRLISPAAYSCSSPRRLHPSAAARRLCRSCGGCWQQLHFQSSRSQRVGAVVCQSYAAPLFIPQVLIKGRSGWVAAAAAVVKALAWGRIHPRRRWRQLQASAGDAAAQIQPPAAAAEQHLGLTIMPAKQTLRLILRCYCSLSCVAKCYLIYARVRSLFARVSRPHAAECGI